jgi:hypothetical protein
MIQHFQGLGWDVTAAGDVQYWTRLTIDSAIKWPEPLGRRVDTIGSILPWYVFEKARKGFGTFWVLVGILLGQVLSNGII